jgi:uncharacterized delta-60 repeat protein
MTRTRQALEMLCLLTLIAIPGRLLAADGAFDPTFQPDGIRVASLGPPLVFTATALAYDGTLLGIGYKNEGGEDDSQLIGLRDDNITSFCSIAYDNVGLTWDDRPLAAAMQSNGWLVVGGWVEGMPGDPSRQPTVQRVGSVSCSRDSGFDGDGKVLLDFGFPGEVRAIAVQPDGKIVVAGVRELGDGASQGMVARLLANGSLDPGFGTGGQVVVAPPNTDDVELNALAIDADGRIVVAGLRYEVAGNDVDVIVVRMLPTGVFDTTFSADGVKPVAVNLDGASADVAYGVTVLPDHRIVAVGRADTTPGSRGLVVLLTSDGSLDPSFGLGGVLGVAFVSTSHNNQLRAVVRQRDGKLVAVGSYAADILLGAADVGVVRLVLGVGGPYDLGFDGDGLRTVTVDGGGLNSDSATAVTLDQGGKIAIVGSSSLASGAGGLAIRLQAGLFVDSFESGGDGVWSKVVP